MQHDIQAALGLLAQAAKGRAFMWDNPRSSAPTGFRAVHRVKIYAQMTLEGMETYEASAIAADHTTFTLAWNKPTLADAFVAAYAALKALPLAADVVSSVGLPPSVHIGVAVNDAVPLAAEGVA
ncbi:MAG: hypothetical protein ACLGJC_05130 [Alphaproteobacteria bacterium]